MSMCLPNTREPHIELAIDVFKSQNPILLISLKDFLTVLPNPKCVEEVLTAALYQLAETDSDACRWILRNSHYLEPELDIAAVAIQLASTKLQKQGFVLGIDFQVELNHRLQVTEQAKARLMIENSPGDRLLIEKILQASD